MKNIKDMTTEEIVSESNKISGGDPDLQKPGAYGRYRALIKEYSARNPTNLGIDWSAIEATIKKKNPVTDFTNEELGVMEEALTAKLHSLEGFLKIQPKDNWCSVRRQLTKAAIEKIKALRK